ncbi:MAG: nuclease [Myxococcales bacterium]|nr:nuclease [Myxococcales bacterium]
MPRHKHWSLMKLGTIALVVSFAATARAWDDFGHMEVAALAFGKLNPRAKARVAELLRLNPSFANWIVGAKAGDRDEKAFLRAATWADALRSDKKYQPEQRLATTAGPSLGYADLSRHESWHYVSTPFSADGTWGPPAPVPNAATQIALLRDALSSQSASDDAKSYGLVWLLHLVGDIHMPLHCISRFDKGTPFGDRGGNGVHIKGNAPPPICDDPRYCPFGPPDVLHLFYDDLEGASYAAEVAAVAAATLPKPEPRAASVGDVAAWVKEGFELAKSEIYIAPIGSGPGPFTVTPAYQAAAERLAKARIALAGARLANLLNDSLGRGPDAGSNPSR